jgi:hypothetical protein
MYTKLNGNKYVYFFTKLFFISTILLVGFLSCKKDNNEIIIQPQQEDLTKLPDSLSYTLDGVTYTCNVLTGQGGGNAGANLDTSNGGWKWDSDTVQYFRSYDYRGSQFFAGGNGGNLTIKFVKKFAKAQLTRTVAPGIFGPVSDTLLYYQKGEYPFAVDFERFNNQNGIVLDLIGTVSGSNAVQIMSTYCYKSAGSSTTITNDSQKDSKFEIINIAFVPAYQGWWNCHLIEAKFSANVFDSNERPHHVDGYIRIHVD